MMAMMSFIAPLSLRPAPRRAAADGTPGLRRPGLCGGGRVATAARGGWGLGHAAAAGLPDRGHPRVGRADRPERVAPAPAFRPSGGWGPAVRLDGRGAK